MLTRKILGKSLSVFGDGYYSQNIIQDGSILQPQTYVLDGTTTLYECIVVTGAATVAPNAETGSSVAMGRNLVVIGGSLTSSTNVKGLVLLFNGGTYLRSGGSINMDRVKGYPGNFGNINSYSLLPAALKLRVSGPKHSPYTILGRGAEGGLGTSGTWDYGQNGITPSTAGAMQTGGGQGGAARLGLSGAGGCGGPFAGGAGGGGGDNGGTAGNAGDYGGPGGYGVAASDCEGGGGSGIPNWPSGGYQASTRVGLWGTSGLLMLFSPIINIASGCILSSIGQDCPPYGYSPGGATGGGCVVCVHRANFVNSGTISVAGGAGGAAAVRSPGPAYGGGVGSVNIFSV